MPGGFLFETIGTEINKPSTISFLLNSIRSRHNLSWKNSIREAKLYSINTNEIKNSTKQQMNSGEYGRPSDV